MPLLATGDVPVVVPSLQGKSCVPPPANDDIPVVVPSLQEESCVPPPINGDVPVVVQSLQGENCVPPPATGVVPVVVPSLQGESCVAPPANGNVPVVAPLLQMGRCVPRPIYKEARVPKVPTRTSTVPRFHSSKVESVFGRMREAHRWSTEMLYFLQIRVIILITLAYTIIVDVIVVIPFSMIVIGSINLHECPAEPYIPIYLIVGGVFSVFKQLLSFYQWIRKRNEESEEHLQTSFEYVVNCFLFAWFIAGNVWVYKIYEPEYEDQQSDNYCYKTLYLFSFWLISSAYIIMGILIFCLCCYIMLHGRL